MTQIGKGKESNAIMGQTLNKHELFIKELKASLKTRGIWVKKKDLVKFFILLEVVCPWFPQEVTIDEKWWRQVGDCLNDYYRSFGPEKVPGEAFSYWNLINDVLQVRHCHPDVSKIVDDSENYLKGKFKTSQTSLHKKEVPEDLHPSSPASNCPSVSIPMPEVNNDPPSSGPLQNLFTQSCLVSSTTALMMIPSPLKRRPN